jgi:hypothetical protein
MKSKAKRTQSDYSIFFKSLFVDQVEKREVAYKYAQEYYW